MSDLSRYPAAVLHAASNALKLAAASNVTADGHAGEYGPPPIVEVATSLLYLAAGPVQLASIRRVLDSSYTWKHEAEDWGKSLGFSPYVCNGAFIAAADYYGVESKWPRRGLNVIFGLKMTREWNDRASNRIDDMVTSGFEATRFAMIGLRARGITT